MKIAGLQKLTLIDYPDRIAATLFLAGCNLDCGYCYNRWMIDASRAPEALPVEAFLDWLRIRVGKLDGVCVSGGEPTLAPDLPDLLRAIKGLGFAVKLDTNGTRPAVLGVLLDEGLLDYVAVDIKAPLDERYAIVAGRPVDPVVIRRTLALLRAWGGPYELRTTVGPTSTAPPCATIAKETPARGALGTSSQYMATPRCRSVSRGLSAPSEDDLREAAEELRAVAGGVRLRGE